MKLVGFAILINSCLPKGPGRCVGIVGDLATVKDCDEFAKKLREEVYKGIWLFFKSVVSIFSGHLVAHHQHHNRRNFISLQKTAQTFEAGRVGEQQWR
jgi:hypothetical protein